MLLTLLVVPVAYSLLESATRRLLGLFRRRPALEPAIPMAGGPAAPSNHVGASNGHVERNGMSEDIGEAVPARSDDQ